MSQYTPEQVEECADGYDALGEPVGASMLRAYAATLRQAARVDEAMVQRALDSWYDLEDGIHGDELRDRMRAALEAALSARPLIHESGSINHESAQPADRGTMTPAELAKRLRRGELWLPAFDPPGKPVEQGGGWQAAFREQRAAAMRAHTICYETMLAHPEVAELGDDGRLHDAIHDILRVDGLAALSQGEDFAGLLARLKVAARALIRERVIYFEDVETLGELMDLLKRLSRAGAGACPKCGAPALRTEVSGACDMRDEWAYTHPAAPVGVPDGIVLVRKASMAYWQRELNGARQGDNAQQRAELVHSGIAAYLAAPSAPQGDEADLRKIDAEYDAHIRDTYGPQVDRHTDYVSGSVDSAGRFQPTQQDHASQSESAQKGVDRE